MIEQMQLTRFSIFALLALATAGCATSRQGKTTQCDCSEQFPPPAIEVADDKSRTDHKSLYAAASNLAPSPAKELKRESAVPLNEKPRIAQVSAVELSPLPPPVDMGDATSVQTPEALEAVLPVESSGRQSLPIDFGTALALTQGQNPSIAFTQAQISHAFAQYEAARVLWLPSIRAGMNYNKHEGRIQDVVGNNIETSRGAAFGGLGAGAVGAGSPTVPGVYMQFHLSDAIHQREIRGFAYDARRFDNSAAFNDQLLETSLVYLSLLSAHQQTAIAKESLKNGEELAKLTADFARTGAGTQADADRAEAALSLLRNEVIRAEESIAVSSARLAQQLSADPAILIVPTEPAVVPLALVSLDQDLASMVATGLSNRPELAASRSLVAEAVSRLRREKNAPWLPSVAMGVSYGAFGAGTGGDITNGADRFDFDAVAWWEVRNLGLGERAARDTARAQIQAARMREVETLDLVAREIAEAHAQVDARKRLISVSEQGIKAAQLSYTRNLDRIKNGQGLPIEVLQSIQALDAARRDYLRSVQDYNAAQFRLQRALGWPISDQ